MLFWTNPGSSTLQNSICTATYRPSHKPCWASKKLISNILLWTPSTSKIIYSLALCWPLVAMPRAVGMNGERDEGICAVGITMSEVRFSFRILSPVWFSSTVHLTPPLHIHSFRVLSLSLHDDFPLVCDNSQFNLQTYLYTVISYKLVHQTTNLKNEDKNF